MERPKDQRLLHPCATGELFPPDKKEDGHTRDHLCCFSLSFLPNYREAIKGEAGATSRESNQQEFTATKQSHIHTFTHHPSQET
jgi:hypothetical protein